MTIPFLLTTYASTLLEKTLQDSSRFYSAFEEAGLCGEAVDFAQAKTAATQPIGRASVPVTSNGTEHLGSALERQPNRPFPGPPSGEGPPLRILPVGGLGEIGMNCMLVGVYDRYILIDAGLMFPDFSDLGMNKILPDTTFLAEWKDKIEAVIITHGHEDHIGALPWVIPALDPNTPIYAGAFTMQLVRRRLQEFNLFNEQRFHTFKMRDHFQAGPFECSPLRVTHSIPDCCGLILRSEHGNIVHTGDWKIEEDPVDGQKFDRTVFEQIGETTSEASVEQRLMRRVLAHQGKGRVIATQFASNIHRQVHRLCPAVFANRKICFVGMSLNTYLEAAANEGMAPFNPKELIPVTNLDSYDPNEVLVVTTGSQVPPVEAEPRAALCLASREASHLLKLAPTDLLLYSAKIIPGNDTKVMSMMNNVSALGVEIAMGAAEGLHTSGHAYRDELEEVMKLVKPQHFLPVHGEYSFLTAHAQLAQDVGIKNTSVIRNGQMLGVHHRRNGNEVSTTGASVKGMQLLGDVKLRMLYNDGNKGTGSDEEMGIEERQQLATEGIVVAAVDIVRGSMASSSAQETVDAFSSPSGQPPQAVSRPTALRAQIRVTTRAMWVDSGRLLEVLHKVSDVAVRRLPQDASLVAVERSVADAIRRACKEFNQRHPDVIVIAHEMDPREGAAARASLLRRKTAQGMRAAHKNQHQQQHTQSQQRQQHQRPQPTQQLDTQQQHQQQHGERTGSSSEQDVPDNTHSSMPVPQRARGRPRKTDRPAIGATPEASASASLASSSETDNSLESPTGADSAADINLTAQDLSSGSAHSAAPAEIPSNSVDAPVKRSRGRPRKNPASVQVVPASTQQPSGKRQTSSTNPGELRDVPAEVLKQRRDANPREDPIVGDDVAFD
ncbi:MAG: ribonuclease J-like [Trebouxia sp. A1-2]|nr:MAG: ribonuclease J-like [Trebouxia sp. A1-2]